MEQSNNNPGPIVEESTLKHIGYALELIGKVIEDVNSPTSTFLYDVACDSTPHLEELIKIQHHLVNAKWSIPRVSFHEGAVTISTVEWKDEQAPSIADELEAADLEGWN